MFKSFSLNSRFINLLVTLAAIIWLFICYLPGLHESFFLFDDQSLIEIPQIRASLDWHLIKTWLTPGVHLDFYPLRDLSYWLDVHLFAADITGADAITFRIQNFFWVLLSAAGVYGILIQLTVHKLPATLLALTWLLHPMHSELLMWTSARKDCMALAFGIASGYFFIRFATQNYLRWGILASLCFGCSLLSKATLIALPVGVLIALILSRFWNKNGNRPQIRLFWIAALSLMFSLGMSIIQVRLYSTFNDMRFFYSPHYRIVGTICAFGRYWAGLLWSHYNAVDLENWGNWAQLNQEFIPIGISFLILFFFTSIQMLRKKNISLLYALVIFGALYLPTSSLFFPHRNLYSVRYFEAPILAIEIGFAYLLLKNKQSHQRTAWLCCCLLIWAAVGTFQEADHWNTNLDPLLKSLLITPKNLAIQRTVYYELLNLRRWGRLNDSQRVLLQGIQSNLSKECTPFYDSRYLELAYRNSHLCLTFWLDIVDKKIDFLSDESQTQQAVIGSLEKVNPSKMRHFIERMKKEKKTQVQQVAIMSAPSFRLEYWLKLCLSSQDFEIPKNWIDQSRQAHLIDKESIQNFVASLPQKYLLSKDQIRHCLN